jgi:hypothetical protein
MTARSCGGAGGFIPTVDHDRAIESTDLCVSQPRAGKCPELGVGSACSSSKDRGPGPLRARRRRRSRRLSWSCLRFGACAEPYPPRVVSAGPALALRFLARLRGLPVRYDRRGTRRNGSRRFGSPPESPRAVPTRTARLASTPDFLPRGFVPFRDRVEQRVSGRRPPPALPPPTAFRRPRRLLQSPRVARPNRCAAASGFALQGFAPAGKPHGLSPAVALWSLRLSPADRCCPLRLLGRSPSGSCSARQCAVASEVSSATRSPLGLRLLRILIARRWGTFASRPPRRSWAVAFLVGVRPGRLRESAHPCEVSGLPAVRTMRMRCEARFAGAQPPGEGGL